MMWKFLQIQAQHLLLQALRSSYDILAVSNKPCALLCVVSYILPKAALDGCDAGANIICVAVRWANIEEA